MNNSQSMQLLRRIQQLPNVPSNFVFAQLLALLDSIYELAAIAIRGYEVIVVFGFQNVE